MTTGIIIPTIRANETLLEACLQAVEMMTPADTQVLVAEGGTFAENCNAGARLLDDCPVIVFLNDDTEVQSGWLDALTSPLSDPHVGIVGAKLLYPDGRVQHAGVYLDSSDGFYGGHHVQTDELSRFVDAVTGACMAVRRDEFLNAGGFDEGYRNGNEDMDLCLRYRAAGRLVWYARGAVVIHYESASGPARWTYVSDNIARFQRYAPTGDTATQ